VKLEVPSPYHLLLKRNDFIEAGRLLIKLGKPKKGEEALLFHEDGCLMIDMGGMSVGATAQGSWPSGGRTAAGFIFSLFRVPPEGEQIVVSFDGDRLHVNNSSMDASRIFQPILGLLPQIFALTVELSVP
jgi:hypothetical protein